MEPQPGIPGTPDQFPETGPNSLASIGQRALGRLIDFIVLLIPFFLIVLPKVDTSSKEPTVDLSSGSRLLLLLAPLIYETVLIAWRGQTVGKIAVGTRVARLGDGGTPIPTQAGIRAALPVGATLVPIVGGILSLAVYLVAIVHPLRQGWHDRAAGTVVVRTR